MTDTKHTPGPWVVPSSSCSTWISTDGDPYGHGRMHVADARGWGHLTGQGACGFDSNKAAEIQDANARLIAAAPDMLKALRPLAAQDCESWGCDIESEEHKAGECEPEKARAAIEKATKT